MLWPNIKLVFQPLQLPCAKCFARNCNLMEVEWKEGGSDLSKYNFQHILKLFATLKSKTIKKG